MSFEETVARFDLNPYLVVTVGGQRVSSFASGTPGALVFFWQAPTPAGATEGRTYIVQTQAPHAIELIQQAVRSGVDGMFGDATRTAIINDARAHDVNFPDTEPALAPLMAYALNRAFFGGVGRVGIPGRAVYPNVHTALRAAGNSTRLIIRDLATGQQVNIVPMNVGGQTVSLPSTAGLAPSAAPTPVPPPIDAPPPAERPDVRTLSDADRRVLGAGTAPAAAGSARVFVSASAPEYARLAPWTVAAPWRIISQEPTANTFRMLAEGPPGPPGSINISVNDRPPVALTIPAAVAGQQVNVVVAFDASGNPSIDRTWTTPVGTDASQAPAATQPESAIVPVGNNALGDVTVSHPPPSPPSGMSTPAKWGVGIGIAALLGGGAYVFRHELGLAKRRAE